VAWWKRHWYKFAASYDAPAAAVQSNPTAILLGVGSLVAGLLAIGYVPELAAISQLRMAWLPAAFATAGASCSYLAWRRKATGPVGTACMLLDTTLYTTSLSLAAVLCASPFSVGFAIALALFLLAFPSRMYALTWPIAVAMCGPPLLTLIMGREALVGVVVWAACSVALTSAYRNGQQRALKAQNESLRNALGAADEVVERGMQTALAASLLDIGHFLHELRNLRASQQANLQFVHEEGGLQGDALEALEEIISAQADQNQLISDAVERLRRKAQPAREPFVLNDVLTEFVSNRTDSFPVDLDMQGPRFLIEGDTEHVRAVMTNLVRNARKAGAARVQVQLRPNADAKSVRLVVRDDGPGLQDKQIEELFKPFAGHADRTGLGLYLASRYISLLGGRIEVSNHPEGGAMFRLDLPGRSLNLVK